MGGGKASGGDHGHGAGHGGHGHDHHHHKPRVYNSVINYHIPDPGHHVEPFKAPDWKTYKVITKIFRHIIQNFFGIKARD